MLNTQAAAIATILETVTDIGRVVDHAPNPAPAEFAKFITAMTTIVDDVRQVRLWTVQYVGETRERTAIAMGATKTIRHVDWMIRGHLSWSTARDTEQTFRDLLDGVVTALDAGLSLGGTALDHDPCRVQLPAQGAGIMLGDVLCHYAEVSLRAKVEQTLATT
jgi:hypothetical protein